MKRPAHTKRYSGSTRVVPVLKKTALLKSFDRNYDAPGGSAPAARASPVAIVSYYLYTTVQIFSVPVIQRHRNVPQHPMGAGLAQGGYHHYEKRFSPEHIFDIRPAPWIFFSLPEAPVHPPNRNEPGGKW